MANSTNWQSKRVFCICDSKWIILIQSDAFWNEKLASNVSTSYKHNNKWSSKLWCLHRLRHHLQRHLGAIPDNHSEIIRSTQRCTINNKLKQNWICKAHLQYLGNIVRQNQVQPTDVKVKAISDFPVPSCRKKLMRFLGMMDINEDFVNILR